MTGKHRVWCVVLALGAAIFLGTPTSLWLYVRSPQFKAKRLAAELHRAPPGLLARWCELLGILEPRPSRSFEAIAGELVPLGETAADAVIQEHARGLSWTTVTAALREIGPAGIPAMKRGLESDDSDVRLISTIAFQHLRAIAGGDDELTYNKPQSMETAVHLYYGAARWAPRSIARLLRDDDEGVRVAAAETLAHFGDLACGELPLLAEAFGDVSPAVREAAALAIGVIGGDGDPQQLAMEELSRCLKNDSGAIRASAVRALGAMTVMPEMAKPIFLGCLKDRSVDVRVEAALALAGSTAGGTDPIHEGVIPRLLEGLRSRSPDVRIRCIEAIGTTRASRPDVIAGLEQAKRDEEKAVRQMAEMVLSRITND